MEDNSEFFIEGGVTLALPPDTPSTLTQEDGEPDVRRLFPGGPAVFAVSVLPNTKSPADAVGEAAGDVVLAYRSHPGYIRTSRPYPTIEGADDAVLLDFEWQDSHGVQMHSLVLVAASAHSTVVVHGAMPVIHGTAALEEMAATVLSCSLTDEAGG